MAEPITDPPAGRGAGLESLVKELHQKGVRQVTIAGKVATVTSAGGEKVTFRGRLVVTADLGSEGKLEYVEQVPPYATTPQTPSLPVTPAVEPQLRQAQIALMSQLRAYREQYQSRMAAARSDLTSRLQAAGISVISEEG